MVVCEVHHQKWSVQNFGIVCNASCLTIIDLVAMKMDLQTLNLNPIDMGMEGNILWAYKSKDSTSVESLAPTPILHTWHYYCAIAQDSSLCGCVIVAAWVEDGMVSSGFAPVVSSQRIFNSYT